MEPFMSLRVTFELRDSDLSHFRKIMREAREVAVEHSPEEILQSAHGLLEAVKDVELPDFVRGRLERIKILIDMLEDAEWQLPKEESDRVMNALAYFSEPEDLIPDHVPGLGFLDDAIMVELVCREFQFEIEAYSRFCRMRAAEEQRGAKGHMADKDSREKWLAEYRKQLQGWMKERRHRSRHGGRRSGSQRSPFSLF
jgi:uncharacterized membrane protein YkvA (DUF1232 family)